MKISEILAESKGWDIDQDDLDEFSPEQIERIKASPFPDKSRENIRRQIAQDKKKAWLDQHRSDGGGDSGLIGPLGGSSSSNDY